MARLGRPVAPNVATGGPLLCLKSEYFRSIQTLNPYVSMGPCPRLGRLVAPRGSVALVQRMTPEAAQFCA